MWGRRKASTAAEPWSRVPRGATQVGASHWLAFTSLDASIPRPLLVCGVWGDTGSLHPSDVHFQPGPVVPSTNQDPAGSRGNPVPLSSWYDTWEASGAAQLRGEAHPGALCVPHLSHLHSPSVPAPPVCHDGPSALLFPLAVPMPPSVFIPSLPSAQKKHNPSPVIHLLSKHLKRLAFHPCSGQWAQFTRLLWTHRGCSHRELPQGLRHWNCRQGHPRHTPATLDTDLPAVPHGSLCASYLILMLCSGPPTQGLGLRAQAGLGSWECSCLEGAFLFALVPTAAKGHPLPPELLTWGQFSWV